MQGALVIVMSCVLALPATARSSSTDAGLVAAFAGACVGEADFVEAERARLVAHFNEVLAELRSADTSGLTAAQRTRRAQHIAGLAAYRDRGVFPRRYTGPAGQVPEFRDVHGTRCAMGELLYASGETELVDHVAATANSATIAELSADPRLTRWLEDNGLTVAEAGRVQPSYNSPPSSCLCSPNSASEPPEALWLATAAGEAVVSAQGDGGFDVPLDLVERVGGSDARSVSQRVTGTARYEVALGDSLLVRFDGFYTVAYPVDHEAQTVSCSTGASAQLHAFSICRANRSVNLDVAVAAMLAAGNQCYDELEAEDPGLTEGCSGSGCQAESLTPRGLGLAGFAAALFLVLLGRRRRTEVSAAGRAPRSPAHRYRPLD